jgi:hypothetical protein
MEVRFRRALDLGDQISLVGAYSFSSSVVDSGAARINRIDSAVVRFLLYMIVLQVRSIVQLIRFDIELF